MPRLLFVDDDEEILALLTRFFGQHGHSVATARNGAGMFALLQAQTFDLVVLDVMLPQEDGLSICRRLRFCVRRGDHYGQYSDGLVYGPPARLSQQPDQWLLRVGILIFVTLIVAIVSASRLARPIEAFAEAASRFGAVPNARPMTPAGPAELHFAMTAFNTMQAQIQRFITGQAAMFAAISHDLRTPLTRMRLRCEFIEDREQQTRLFRDIDEMQAMITAVLVFLRDNAADEATTNLDLAELLRSIADDYADIGRDVAYTGPQHVAFPGRPICLHRAFENLVDNAVKYGDRPIIGLHNAGSHVTVTVTDAGPGIPADALERVFVPFQRLEPARNPNTSGMGLGLTSARAGFRAHGGDVILSNTDAGGLRATVTLPMPAPNGPTEQDGPEKDAAHAPPGSPGCHRSK